MGRTFHYCQAGGELIAMINFVDPSTGKSFTNNECQNVIFRLLDPVTTPSTVLVGVTSGIWDQEIEQWKFMQPVGVIPSGTRSVVLEAKPDRNFTSVPPALFPDARILIDTTQIHARLLPSGEQSIGSGVWQFPDRRITLAPGNVTQYPPTLQQIQDGVNLTLSSAHGNGPWGIGTAGTVVVTVRTIDQFDQAIGGVNVEVRPSGSNAVVGMLLSSTSDGKAVFNLNPGAHDFYAFSTGLASFPVPVHRLITSSESFDIVGNRFTVTAPSQANKIRFYAYLRDLGLNNQNKVEMFIEPSGGQMIKGTGGTLYVQKPISALSDSTGFVYLDVVHGDELPKPVKISIPKAKLEKFVVPPTSGTLNVATL